MAALLRTHAVTRHRVHYLFQAEAEAASGAGWGGWDAAGGVTAAAAVVPQTASAALPQGAAAPSSAAEKSVEAAAAAGTERRRRFGGFMAMVRRLLATCRSRRVPTLASALLPVEV